MSELFFNIKILLSSVLYSIDYVFSLIFREDMKVFDTPIYMWLFVGMTLTNILIQIGGDKR